MQYRAYIIHTPVDSFFYYDPDAYVMTEYYPNLDKENVQKKIEELNKQKKPYVNKNNCLEWKLKRKTITMTVIDNTTEKTIETANHFLLST